ncbi:MAG: GNAT family protein [Anaerosomatales bacterium]|nr:GNAT family protein [Anaerosomatales bacterium]
MIIREATVEDAAALAEYAAELFAEGLPGIFSRSAPSLEEEIAFISSRIEPENSTLLVAEESGVAVGLLDFVGGTLVEDRHAGVFGVSVRRGWRGRGIGTALIEALLAWAPAHGIERVEARAWASNPRAIALYERLGFEREGVLRSAIKRDGAPIDVMVLARLL